MIVSLLRVVKGLPNCTINRNITGVPTYESFSLEKEDILCFHGDRMNSLISFINIPDNFLILEYEQSSRSDDIPLIFNKTAKDSPRILNSRHRKSCSVIIPGEVGGYVSMSYVALDDECPHGIFVSNSFNFILNSDSNIEPKMSPIDHLQKRCFVFGGGAENIKINVQFKPQNEDKIYLQQTIDTDSSLSIKKEEVILNNDKASLEFSPHNKQPFILHIHTREAIGPRAFLLNLSGVGDSTSRAESDEFVMRPHGDECDEPRLPKWLAYGIPISIGVVIVIIVFAVVVVLLKKRRSAQIGGAEIHDEKAILEADNSTTE